MGEGAYGVGDRKRHSVGLWGKGSYPSRALSSARRSGSLARVGWRVGNLWGCEDYRGGELR